MRLRPRYDHWLAKALKVRGIVLYPYVLFSDPIDDVPERVLRHEMIHVRQVRELGWLRFYFKYLLEYFVSLARFHDHDQAYRSISFEDSAYRGEVRIALSDNDRRELKLT